MNSIINFASEQTIVKMFYKFEFDHQFNEWTNDCENVSRFEFDHQLNEWTNDNKNVLHDSALKTEKLKNVNSIITFIRSFVI